MQAEKDAATAPRLAATLLIRDIFADDLEAMCKELEEAGVPFVGAGAYGSLFRRADGKLAGVGTLEDVSVALWLLALQVHPQHSEQFTNGTFYSTANNDHQEGMKE